MKEEKEFYQDLEDKLASMGSIKEIIKSFEMIKKILTYAGDRNLTALFFRKISNSIKIGEINEADLAILRSNWIVLQMLNLKKLVNATGRDLYINELGDKVNYFSLINDVPALINFYTNPRLINSIVRNSNPELNYWFSRGFYDLPSSVQLAIAKALLIKNDKVKAIKIIDLVNQRTEMEKEADEAEKNRHGF